MRIQKPVEFLDLYDEVGRLCDMGKTSSAFSMVVDALGLSLSAKSHRVFDLMLGKLGEVQRFSGNDHMAKHLRGSTAKHSLQVMVLVGKLMTDTFPDVFYAQSTVRKEYPGFKSRRPYRMNATKFRTQISNTLTDLAIQALMHDFGKIFVDLSTLSQRRKANNCADLRGFERKFVEFSMRLAYSAVEEHPGYARQKKVFDTVIDNIRKDIAGLVEQQDSLEKAIAGRTVAEAIDKLIEPYKAKHNLAFLPLESLREFSYYMRSFDEPEGHGHFESFNGMVVKTCQNIHTITQMVEHAGREGGVPYSYANSATVKDALYHGEKDLNNIWKEMEPGNSIQQDMARHCAKLAYSTILGVVRLPIPLVIDFAAGLKQKFSGALANDNPSAPLADPETALAKGWSELHVAAMNGDVKKAMALLERGADVDVRAGKSGWTPLHIATSYGQTSMVRLLLEHGADPDARADKGWTPLHVAAYTNRPYATSALLDGGADAQLRTDDGMTAQHWAQKMAHDKVVMALQNSQDEGESAPGTPERLAEIRRAAIEFCKPKNQLPTDLRALEQPVMKSRRIDDFSGTKRSIYQLYALYAAAYYEADQNPNFKPPQLPEGKAMFELDKVPAKLRQKMRDLAPKGKAMHPRDLPKPPKYGKSLFRHRFGT